MKKPQKDLNNNKLIRLLIAIVTALIITAMFPEYETIEADYSEGMIWSKEDLIAPFTFPVYKSESLYEKEVNDAANSILPIYQVSSDNDDWLDSINSFFAGLDSILTYENEMNRERSLSEDKRTTNPQTLQNMKNNFRMNLESNEWDLLYRLNDRNGNETNIENIKKRIIQSLNEIYNKRIADTIISSYKEKKIAYVENRTEETIDISEIYSRADIERILTETFHSSYNDPVLIQLVHKISMKFIYYDLVYDNIETEKVRNSAISAIPRTMGIVKENERIISKHEAISETARLKLESYKRIRNEQMGSRDFYLQTLGRFLLMLSLFALIGIFLFKLRKRIYNDNGKLIILASIILFVAFLAYLSLNIEIAYPAEYMIFVPAAAILLTIIFDSRVSFYLTIIICIIIAALRGGDYEIMIPHFVAASLSIYSVRDIKNRSQIFTSMFYIFLGYLVSIIALNLDRNQSFNTFTNQLMIAGFNSLLSPVIVYGLLLFYEKVFRIATDLVFLELSDFNHPLLRELAAKAPGTFHHSMVMGNLSEQAAKDIDANQILTRVGCYYHDIGKVVKPDYFVENQLDSNKHEELNPSLSAKMIISHVRFGIQLAEKYRLPKEIIEFIPMHHGTTLVSYFFSKAKSEDMNAEEIHDFIYRYPGPKPRTKETGIVMLADSVEAACRAIEDPTPAKIETQIDEIIKDRFLEGELDECPLTLRDLLIIKQSFLRTLVGIHHHRLKYPDEDADEKNKKR